MLLTIALSLIYVELKRMTLAKIVSELLRKFWNEWELRVMLLFSLSLQFLLVKCGDRVKYPGLYVTILVWVIYLLADWAATVVLSTLLRGPIGFDKSLVIFWTPFLLWHLGSPFNITAYSLEDNEIWLRHLLGLLIQSGSAVYVFFRFWTGSALAYMAVPILVAGVFKYGERIWALRSASEKQLTTSLYSAKDTDVIETKMIRTGWMARKSIDVFNEEGLSVRNSYVDNLRFAHFSYKFFKPLFSDLRFQVSEESLAAINISSKSPEDAFALVETELRFLYDTLYTKVPLQQSWHFIAFHSFCFFASVATLIAFSILVGKLHYQTVDVAVTYLLLVSAIALDLYSALVLSVSKWTLVRWTKPRNWLQKLYCRFVASKVSNKIRSRRAKGGSKSMAQHDLVNYFVEKKKETLFTKTLGIFDTANLLQKFRHTRWENVTPELRSFIFFNLLEKHKKKLSDKACSCSDEGGPSPEFLPEDIRNSLMTKGFVERVFIWHIATNLLYYNDHDMYPSGTLGPHCEISKCLSNYMMYLVLVRPTMLPRGFNEVINRETCSEAARLFPGGKKAEMENISFNRTRKVFISSLLSLIRVSNAPVFLPGKKISALLDGCWLANQLREMVTAENMGMGQRYDQEEKWEMVSKVWMEMMSYAASHCAWREHAKELIHGGELLSYVSLLMAHLGLNKQITQIKPDFVGDMKSRF